MTPERSLTRRAYLSTIGGGIGLGLGAGGTAASGPARQSISTEELSVTIEESSSSLGAERCRLGIGVLFSLGVGVGEQVRIACTDCTGGHESGLYTVDGAYFGGFDAVAVDEAGLERLGYEAPASGVCRPWAPHPTYETKAQADDNDEFVELLADDGSQSDLVVCAPHGGWIEHPTDEQAAYVADALAVTNWSCVGYNAGGGAYDRWHITSTDIDQRSFPKLGSIADRGFDHAVSFHGFSESGIVIGGAAPDSLKTAVADAIDDATGGAYDVETTETGEYAGTDPDNFVNWLSEGNGVQLEQSWDARQNHWTEIADAVAAVYDERLAGSS